MSDKKRLADEKLIIEAVARGWCHKSTADKEFDSDLALAISEELKPVFASQIRANIKEVLEKLEFPCGPYDDLGDDHCCHFTGISLIPEIRSRYGIKG